MADGDGLEIPISLTERRYLQQLGRIEAALTRTANRVQRQAERTGRVSTRSFTSANQAANRFAGGGLRNLSLQFSQVAQQASATGDPIRALAIQLPDMAIGFGALGIAIGAVAGALLPLGVEMLRTGESSEELAERAEALAKAVDAYSAAAAAAAVPTEDLREQYGTAATAAREFLNALRDIAEVEAGEALNARLDDLAATLGAFDADFGRPVDEIAAMREELTAEIERLSLAAFDALDTAAAASFDRQREALEAQLVALDQYSDDVQAVAREYGIAEDQARDLAAALNNLANADGLNAQVEAARLVSDLLLQIFGGYEAMPAPIRTMYNEMVEVGEQLAEVKGTSEETLSVLERLSQSLQSATGYMEGLAAGAGTLWENLTKAAEAADELRQREARVGRGRGGAAGPSFDEIRENVPGAQLSEHLGQNIRLRNRSRSRSGGGGANRDPFFQDIERQIDALDRQIATLGKSQAAIAGLEAEWALLDAAKERGLDLDAQLEGSSQTLREAIRGQADEVERLTAEYEDLISRQQALEDIVQSVSGGFADAFVDAVSGAESFADAFRNMASQILADLARMIVQQTIYNALAGALGLPAQGGGVLAALGLGLPGRASGGPVKAGQAYMVGETGRELFVPSQNGQILSAPDTRGLMRGSRGAAGGSDVRVEPKIAVYNQIGPSDFGQMIQDPEVISVLNRVMTREGFTRDG